MHIKYIRAKNFLSIGNESIEIDFTKYGNIINIKGENRDQGPGASNGVGKSTIFEIIVYGLFGKLIKNLNHKQAINIKSAKNLEVEVYFNLGGSEYRIIRTRKPDDLKFWRDGVDETRGGITATQEGIESVIKLNYTAFINVACFGQHNVKQFLSCVPADKRAIAENLLALDKYNRYCDLTKRKFRDLNDRLKYLSAIYEKSIQDVSASERQVKQFLRQQDEWKAAQLNAIERLKCQIDKARAEIVKQADTSSSDNYVKLQTVNLEIEEQRTKKLKLSDNINLAYDKINQLKDDSQGYFLSLKEAQYAANKAKKDIEDVEKHSDSLLSQEGNICRTCFGVIDPANFKDVIAHNKHRIKDLKEDVEAYEYNYNVLHNKRDKVEEYLIKLKNIYEDLKSQEMYCNKAIKDLEQRRIVLSSAFHENATSAILILEQQIEGFMEQIENRNNELLGADPYTIVLVDTRLGLEMAKNKSHEFRSEIANLEEQAPYYKFWIEAFGDTGIRSFVLGEIIPILNMRINYWLQFLVDSKIKLSFNNELEECIERNPPDGDPFVYAAMSGGEHQRIDLGIALAFAQVMMLTSNVIPSIVCLDEVGTNLDRPGIQAVYNAICELSHDRQVLVTTHDPDLLELLASHEAILVIKQDGYTKLQNQQ